MSLRKLAVGMAVAATACLAGSSPVLASGLAKPITRNCASGSVPAANQVFVYNSSLACWVLEINNPDPFTERWGGFDPLDSGFPNDAIQYVKVGSGVRARFFWNWFWTHDEGGSWTQDYWWSPSTLYYLGSMAGNASAVRVESQSQPYYCSTQSGGGYTSIWDTTGAPTNSDCNMLSDFKGPYPGAPQMAFRNDNLSAFAGGRGRDLYNDANYGGGWITNTYGFTCMYAAYLPSCGIGNYNSSSADNKVSSIY